MSMTHPLARARGHGSARDGVHHWFAQRASAVLLILLAAWLLYAMIVLVAASLGLVQATSWPQAIGTTLLIAGAGALFWFMIKAMARIQMPRSPGAE